MSKSSTWWFVERINELEADNKALKKKLRELSREHRLTAAELQAHKRPKRHLQQVSE